jgi:hypothetical protein
MDSARRTTGAAAMKRFLVLLALAGCIGGQPSRTKAQSDALGDRSKEVPTATKRERDWKQAATGHGAAGNIPASELAKREAGSAPGAR